MSSDILLKFAKKGINLSPKAYEMILESDDSKNLTSSLIVKLKSGDYDKDDYVSVSKEIVCDILGIDISNTEYNKKNSENTDNKDNNKQLSSSPREDSKKDNNFHKETIKENNNSFKTIDKKEFIQADETEKSPNINLTPKEEEDKKGLYDNQAENNEFDASEIRYNPGTDIKPEKIENIKNPKSKHSIYRRNLEKTNVKYDFQILQDTSKKSYTSGEISNLISYFASRYEKESKILLQRPDLKLAQKIEDINRDQTDLALILMVNEVRTTKNGHKLIEFEDDTGQIPILVSKDNAELMSDAEKLVKDEVVGILASKMSGDNKLAIANQIIHPDVPRIAKKEMDFGIVFLSDVHIGSKTFLPEAFERFIMWINCEYGNEEQVAIAKDVKYLIIGGDIVDGIGVYPNQEKELEIKDIRQQYDKAASYLGQIRKDIKIIISPGNHDASRVAEPQPAVPEKYANALYELDNVEFISNPGYVSLDGIKVLIYHGRSFDDLAMSVKGFSHERNDILMEELLKKRHLAPIYGERTPLASELEDYLVIEDVPDVFHTGHVHINTHRVYNGIHLINSGTFQTQTEFQKIYNIVPTPAEVPILDKGVYKQLKFV
ncbi:DNA-directed DNA polymerase II small subunit [uncultured Methanobrevibacter sp.]|uniref:DNA-directed DNA polymerase II small subunit n=1 Tax=uncultured Methanobrevibacter sp. TaxID=253161 RepID=UPI0025FFCC9F|nr:DNA-directed DNA polymerase II small subunit [uncultured Methanobrevibacter sp.]